MFVTYAVVNVWTGIKQSGNDPTGDYVRLSGYDPRRYWWSRWGSGTGGTPVYQ